MKHLLQEGSRREIEFIHDIASFGYLTIYVCPELMYLPALRLPALRLPARVACAGLCIPRRVHVLPHLACCCCIATATPAMSDSARKKQPISPGREAGATPNANARLEPSTPFLRAFNAGPTPGSRRTPTFRTPGTARTPRGGPATRPISARRVAPTTPHAIRALRERANAARTPGNNRRRSGRVQRETPRDILRDLSRGMYDLCTFLHLFSADA